MFPLGHGNERHGPDIGLRRALEVHFIVDAPLLFRIRGKTRLQVNVANRCLGGFVAADAMPEIAATTRSAEGMRNFTIRRAFRLIASSYSA